MQLFVLILRVVARWCGGAVARWRDGALAWWLGGAVVWISDSQSREHGFESSCCRFEAWAISSTPRCSDSMTDM